MRRALTARLAAAGRRRRRLAPVAAILAAAALAPSPAAAAPDLQTGIADDAILLFSPERAPSVVAKWQAMGIEVVRIHARWIAVAPDKAATRPPRGFHAGDHLDPHYDWAYLDRAVDLVKRHGMEPILAVTGSGPVWGSRVPSRGNARYKPDPRKFAQFASAVAHRYGDRVDRYLLWNEPNQPGWLQPQYDCPAGSKRCIPVAPHVYRDLVRAAYPAIHAADPGAQVIGGTLAPRGGDPTRRNRPMRPLAFLRAFGCVDERYKRVRTGACRGFRPAMLDGFAYHPHGVLRGPGEPNPHRDEAAIADLPRLEQTLDAVQDAGGFRTPFGQRVPLHLTEFGYQTLPPDPYSGVTPAQQRDWLQQAAYVAWKDPRIHTLIQYEWQDEPIKSVGIGRKAYAGWQSGLLYADGRAKPALSVFRNPFWTDPQPDDATVRFWGQVRPGLGHDVSIQRRGPSGGWVPVQRVSTDASGYFSADLEVTSPGSYRYVYQDVAPASAARGSRARTIASAVRRVAPPPAPVLDGAAPAPRDPA